MTLHVGDVREVLATLPDASVNCVVTSPPYFGLRDYGHEGQIGIEATPDEFVAAMVAVFRDVRRVLHDDGTLWLNLGDSYSQGGNGAGHDGSKQRTNPGANVAPKRTAGFGPKQLLGIPWRVALALQADGWTLRQDIIWHKPNPMPEAVKDRCTKAHEYVFLFSKSPRYFYDNNAIAEKSCRGDAGSKFDQGKTALHQQERMATGERPQARRARELAAKHGLTEAHIAAIKAVGVTDAGKAQTTQGGFGKNTGAVIALADEAKAALGGYYREFLIADTRNKRSVWSISTQPFAEAHFATMAPELAETCILAGCPKGGTVLDPFGGAGTTALVALRHGRCAELVEINPEYAAMARRRIETEWRVPQKSEVADLGPLFMGAA
ncbi:MAG: site-specific DNA-methyltransferase [Nitratireductor sp.]